MEILFTLITNFSSRNLPLPGAQPNRGRTGWSFKFSTGNKKIHIGTRKPELANIDRETEADIKGVEILQAIAVPLHLQDCLVEVRNASNVRTRLRRGLLL